MSSNNTKAVSEIISESMATIWQNRKPLWGEYDRKMIICYEWLEQAYPDIFNEFKAVYDIQRED